MSNGRASKKSKHLSLVLRIIVASAAILLAFRGQDWSELGKILAQMNLWFFACALGIFAFSQVIVGLRWWLLLRAQSIFISLWAAVRLHYLGLFYNNFMPGSIGGDLIRAWYVTKHTDRKLEAALSVFVDRIIGLSCMVAIAVFCYLFFMRGQGLVTSSDQGSFLASIAHYKWYFLWLVLGLSVVVFVLLLLRPSRAILGKGWSYVRLHGASVLEKVVKAIIIYFRKPVTLLAAVALTIFVQIMVITAFCILGMNLEIDISAKYYFVFFPITWVLGAVPVSIAGVGIIEGGLRELFTRFAGVAVEKIMALALCNRVVLMLTSLPGAVVHLVGAHLPKDFFIDYKKPIN